MRVENTNFLENIGMILVFIKICGIKIIFRGNFVVLDYLLLYIKLFLNLVL